MLTGKEEIKREIQAISEKQERFQFAILSGTRNLETVKQQIEKSEICLRQLEEKQEAQEGESKQLSVYLEEHTRWLNGLQNGLDALGETEGRLDRKNDDQDAVMREMTDWLQALQDGLDTQVKNSMDSLRKQQDYDSAIEEAVHWLQALQKSSEGCTGDISSLMEKTKKQEDALQAHTDWLQALQKSSEGYVGDVFALTEKTKKQEDALQAHTDWLQALQKSSEGYAGDVFALTEKTKKQEDALQAHSDWLDGLQDNQDFFSWKLKESEEQIDKSNSVIKQFEHWLQALETGAQEMQDIWRAVSKRVQEQSDTLEQYGKWLQAHEEGVQFAYHATEEVERRLSQQEKSLSVQTEWATSLQQGASTQNEWMTTLQEELDQQKRDMMLVHDTQQQLKQSIYSLIDTQEKQNNWLLAIQKNVDRFHEQEKEAYQGMKLIKEEQISSLRQKKKFIIVGTAEHNNVGDSAISLAQQRLLSKGYPDYYQIEFSTYRLREEYSLLCAVLHPEDIFIIQGGGNLGSLYRAEEELHRTVINDFPDHKIVIMPQTVFFEQNEAGQLELKKSSLVYNRHPQLTIFVRGRKSASAAETIFPGARTFLLPDVVCSLDYSFRFDREGVAFVWRNDLESAIDAKLKEGWENALCERFSHITHISHILETEISRENRELTVRRCIQEYAKMELIVTDRLHGVLFSYITNTPCVAFDDKFGKISDFCQTFLSGNPRIYLVKNKKEKPDDIVRELTDLHEMDTDQLKELFENDFCHLHK